MRRPLSTSRCGRRRTIRGTASPVSTPKQISVSLKSLGCPKNVTDAEVCKSACREIFAIVLIDVNAGDVR